MTASEDDLRQIWDWNSKVPQAVDKLCVHELIAEKAVRHPEATAILAWDGSLTYRELDVLSQNVAYRLHVLGVRPEGSDASVVLCFEKSKWTSVAMLGVMKAGGISVAIDVAQPVERLASIVGQTAARAILCSSTTESLTGDICDKATVMSIDTQLRQLPHGNFQLPRPSPEQTLFVTFTSGSTGKPKGARISHANVCTAVHYQGRKLGFNEGARVLDFAPYCFDVAWSNMLHTLCAGGCLCIPSANDMLNDLAFCIDRYDVTLINITPTILRTLDRQPDSLADILLSGEPPDQTLLSRWAGKFCLRNTYGPSECTFKSTFAEISDQDWSRQIGIGKGTGAVTWIVHPENPDQLVAIGEVGELWLEGPIVGQGYLNDDEKTQAAFIQDPAWLMNGPGTQTGRRGRLYRTGDLVKYGSDGSLVFVGRKDRQVKICGCRVELGDVEHHVRESISGDSSVEVVVEAIVPHASESPVLVAFLSVQRTAVDENKLARSLPAYMIPSAYAHMPDGMPRTATGKTDRRRLRELGASSTFAQLTQIQSESPEETSSTSPMEQRMRELWAMVLGVNASTLKTEDNFFERGGDSVRAIRLVGAARDQGLSLSVADVFQKPRLKDLAAAVKSKIRQQNGPIEPFSLLRGTEIAQARDMAASWCGVESSQIEDVLPCTPFQAGLFALTIQRPAAYVSRTSYRLRSTVDIGRFRAAWDQVVSLEPILRTRIISLGGERLVQVVVRSPLEWANGTRRDPKLELDVRNSMTLGTPLAHFALAEDQSSGKPIFVWTMHHALHDGWSRSILLQMADRVYAEESLPPSPPFSSFVDFVMEVDVQEALSAWRDHLRGITAPVFPALPSPDYQPVANATVKLDIEGIDWPSGSITPPTLIQTAWLILIQQYTNSEDVAIGVVTTGREAPIDGVERMTGPMAATVPLGVSLQQHDDETVGSLLSRVQRRGLAMKSFEQIGLTQIRQASAEAEQACNFQTLLVVHPISSTDERQSVLFQQDQNEDSSNDGVDTYSLMLSTQLRQNGARVSAKFDPKVIDHSCLQRMMSQFECVVRGLSSPKNWQKKAVEISALSHDDLADIRNWNSKVPRPVSACVYDLLASVVEKQPDALAIHAWDGDLTYVQLFSLSSRMALSLNASVGVKAEDVVVICCEKSMWTSVAILAVMKAGAASITFDVTQPEARLRSIVQQARPRAILASPANMELANKFDSKISVVSLESLLSGESTCSSLSPVKPDNSLFVVFTSGSTGTPKGIVITHENFSSALVHQSKDLGFCRQRRTFDFASYAFDAAYYNLLHTLYSGGCLCVPSEAERRTDLSGSICRLGATFANLTPQLAGVLDVHALRQLDLLELSGELADAAMVARIRQYTTVRFAYGPAECSVLSTVSSHNAPVSNIGWGLGVCCWVVNCRSSNSLAPVGCVGELWIEGPLVGRGYFEDAENTASAFIDDPEWLLETVGRRGRLYRTGDLVRYKSVGSLIFLGRKDQTQTKIRGQRVELAEVAHHVQQCLTRPLGLSREDITTAAEVAVPSGSKTSQLVAFLAPASGKSISPKRMASLVKQITKNIDQRMSMAVPSYMIPTLFIPLQGIPLTASGKIDRKQLRALVQNTAPEQLKSPSSNEGHLKRLSKTEQRMRSIWARTLKIEETQVDQDSSFWSMGDSISAISLIVAVRQEFGIDLGVSALARHKATLKSLSQQIEAAGCGIATQQNILDLDVSLTEMIGRLNLLAAVDRPVAPRPAFHHGSVAFLTGATGFLGTQILCDLIAGGHFKKVVVLVRAMNGLSKVRRTAQVAGWWRENAAQFIEVWKGDLSKPRLGLATAQWQRLSGKDSSQDVIDTWIHNGAAVHWTADHETLKATNVDSTFQLLELALRSSSLKRFVYVSGGRMCGKEELPSNGSDASGYVQSKYMSERLVLAMAEHPVQPRGRFAVAKPGLIIGRAENGIANADDYLWRLVRSCIRLGSFPLEAEDAWLPIAEVDTVARKIVQQATADEAEAFTGIESGLDVASFWNIVQAATGSRLAATHLHKWLGMMQAAIEEEKEAHPLWPVQQFVGKLGVHRGHDVSLLPGPDELKMIRRLTLAIARNVQYLKEMGMLEDSDGRGQSMAEGLMTRSKLFLTSDVEVSEEA